MKKRILIIDDEELFAKVLKSNLEDTEKYQVKTETLGKNGLVAAKEFRPNLILLDIIMPDLGGDKVAHELKNDLETRNIPIVLLTAILTEEEMRAKGGIVSGFPFISKPVDFEKLHRIIEENIT